MNALRPRRRRAYSFTTAAGLLGLLVLMLSGCATSGTTITFVFMRTSNATEPYWAGVIKDFEAANPSVHVKLHVYTWTDGPAKIAQMIHDGHPPDIARVATR